MNQIPAQTPTIPTMVIDQNLQVALQAGTKNNIFIYHAPRADVSQVNLPQKYDGSLQMLYAICNDLLSCGITLSKWRELSRAVMLQAAVDKFGGNKAKAADALCVSKITDMKQLEYL